MLNINLLPEELKPKKYVLNLATSLKKLATIGYIIFLVFLLVVGGAYFIISANVRKSQERQELLKSEVKALEETEQKLVLVKDRLKKSEQLLSQETTLPQLDVIKKLIQNLSEGSQITKVTLKPQQTEISVSAPSSSGITRYLSSMTTSGFTNVQLVSLRFSQEKGYDIIVNIKN